MKKVFVYGSLRDGMFNYDKFLQGKVKKTTPGTIKGDLFHIENKGYPAVITGDNKIVGELMEFVDFDSTLIDLDGLENYKPNDTNSEYLREVVNVTLDNGDVEKAFFYKYNDKSECNKKDVLKKVSHGDWLKR
ncbi:gamma-glutamylcyclotransferase family protein [Clostridium sp.]|uniref:gamma-glutamylcyclotransferase family protein n=1 Tax=Clostridium sp. TaxID=1506 RepID=UPI002FC739F0